MPGHEERTTLCRTIPSASPLLYGADILMGAARVHGWFLRDAHHFLDQLLETNAARVQGDVEQRVVESPLHLEAEVRKLLREVGVTAEQALTQAKELIASGTNAVGGELDRLERLRHEVGALKDGMGSSNERTY
jgi:hypothetical protein